MDWIFGKKQDPKDISQLLGAAMQPGGGGVGGPEDPNRGGDQAAAAAAAGGGQVTGASSAYRFDSTALERAAAAAKELEKSSKYCHIVTPHNVSVNSHDRQHR